MRRKSSRRPTRAVFVRYVGSGRTRLASHSVGRDCIEPSLSASGRFVAYTCEARSKAKGLDQVYVTDLERGRVRLVSSRRGGRAGGGDSSRPSISASGRYVAFESYANDLGPDDEGRVVDVFVKDLKSGRVLLASRGDGNGPAGNAPSQKPSLSGDGRFVAFESRASNLVAEDSIRNSSVFRYQVLP
jgi:Tol biopolymer transport system component